MEEYDFRTLLAGAFFLAGAIVGIPSFYIGFLLMIVGFLLYVL